MQEQQQARIEDAAAMEADELDEASNSVVHLSLDNVYQTHGDLAQAAAMYKKSIALFQEVRAIPQVQQL